jgi:hypothetical protein
MSQSNAHLSSATATTTTTNAATHCQTAHHYGEAAVDGSVVLNFKLVLFAVTFPAVSSDATRPFSAILLSSASIAVAPSSDIVCSLYALAAPAPARVDVLLRCCLKLQAPLLRLGDSTLLTKSVSAVDA